MIKTRLSRHSACEELSTSVPSKAVCKAKHLREQINQSKTLLFRLKRSSKRYQHQKCVYFLNLKRRKLSSQEDLLEEIGFTLSAT